MQKVLTIRLPEALYSDIAARVETDKTTIADFIRSAVSDKVGGASNAEIMNEIMYLRTLIESEIAQPSGE